MSIIDRVRESAERRVKLRASSILGAVSSAAAMQATSAATRVLGKIDEAQGRVLGGVVRAAGGNSTLLGRVLGSAFGNVGRTAAGAARSAVGRAIRQLPGQPPTGLRAALPPLSGPLQAPPVSPRLAPAGPPPTKWTPAPLWGGLTPEEFERQFLQSAMTARAWKNLFFVSIEELRPSRESPAGAGAINMMAVDVIFGPCIMPGEAVNIGGANMDVLNATDRVELRLTTLDDARGTLKRWFIAKCDQAARLDGTFGLPADYLVVVTVTHMDPTNAGSSGERMRHRWLMRPASVELELSRRSPELEELPMSFVQFDSFMEPR